MKKLSELLPGQSSIIVEVLQCKMRTSIMEKGLVPGTIIQRLEHHKIYKYRNAVMAFGISTLDDFILVKI